MVLPTHLVHWSLPSCRGGSQHLRTAALRTASHRATSAICTEAASPSNPSVRQRCSTQGAASTSGSGNVLTRNQPQPEWRRASTAFGSATARQCTAAAAASSAGSTVGTAVESRNVVEVLRERGLISETTSDELEKAAAEEKLSVYCGFDPTADSLHLGNLLGIIVLSWFQRCGHRPVALLGGATGRVGDPSGKSAERPVLSEQQLEANIAGISAVLEGILDSNKPAGCPEVKFVNNLDWLGGIPFLQFLREVGKYARLGTMLAKDSVRSRLESETGMSFTEFTYQLLQGYDFVHLCREEGVRVQIGGNDQWGNITAGTDLIRRMASPEQPAPDCYGLTFPLLTDAEGRKFGKSEGGAIWLASSKLSPYEFYQHLYRTRDADVVTFLRMLTFLPLPEVDAVAAAMQTPDYEPNTAQKLLAAEVTRFVHGEVALQEAIKTTQALKPGASTVLDAASLEAIAGNAPSCSLPREEVAGRLVSEVLVAAGLQSSKGAARRLIKGGGVYVNNSKVGDEFATLADTDLIEERLVLLASGKKNKMLLRIE